MRWLMQCMHYVLQGGPWHYDVARTARLAAFGGAVGGPIGHYWFNFLDKVGAVSFPVITGLLLTC